MTDVELTRFIAQYAKSVAYHEAGHTTAAVLQEMPLQERGIHVDTERSGISYYWDRKPGHLANSPKDQLERERSIIALYAGIIAQKKSFPDCPEDAWTSDRARICLLLKEMHPAQPTTRSAAKNNLRTKAEELVCQNWLIVEGLASTLLAKPETPLPASEIEEKWSRGKKGVEKWMRGSEVVEFFKKFRITATVLPDS